MVFKVRVKGGHHAVRCFTSNLPDQQRRYDAVSKYFRTRSMPPEFGEFEYQNDGILVNGNRHPILKMVWFDGKPLGEYVDEQIHDSQAMKALAATWLETANSLQNMEIAHNDLQHGNIIVQGSGTNPTIKIVDYDGIFIPDFAGEKSPETGLPHYQHPERDDTHYDREIDNFPALVIYTSLLALSEDRNLIYTRKSNEALLFTKEDFQDPNNSALFQDLCNSSNGELNQAANALRTSAVGPIGAVPRLSALPAGTTAQTQTAPGSATWATQPNAGPAPVPPGKAPTPPVYQAPTAASPNATSIGGVAQQNRNEIDIAIQELAKKLNPVVYRYAQQATNARTWSTNNIPGMTGKHHQSLASIQQSKDSQAMLAILKSILLSYKPNPLESTGLSVNLINRAAQVRNDFAHNGKDFSDPAYVQTALGTLNELQSVIDSLPQDLPAGTPSQGGQQGQRPQQGNHPSQNARPHQGPRPRPMPTYRPPRMMSSDMLGAARAAIAGALATALILTLTSLTDVGREWLMALFVVTIPVTAISFLAMCHRAGWQQALEQSLNQLPWALNTAADLIVRTTRWVANTTRQLWNQLPSNRARIITAGSLFTIAMIGILWYNVQRSDDQGNMETAQNSAAAEAVQADPTTLPAPAVGPASETAPTAQAMPTYLPVIVASTEGAAVLNQTSVPPSPPTGITTPPPDLQVHTYTQQDFSIMYPTGWNPTDDLMGFTAPDGQGRLEIRVSYFDPAWSIQEFIDHIKVDEDVTPGMGLRWKEYIEERTRMGNIGGIEFVEIDFAGQIKPGGCLHTGTTRWLPSRYRPDFTARGYSISISVCEEDQEEYEETMKQVLNSFVESNHDYEILRELQRRAAEATTEEPPAPDAEP